MRGIESDFATGAPAESLLKLGSLREDVIALVRDKRYEEALSILYRARSEAPEDRGLSRSIERLKEFLVVAYAKQLGGLDRTAGPLPLDAARTPDVALLARYIDGVSSYGDVAQMCPLGQVRTLQVLVGLYTGKEPPRIQSVRPLSSSPEEPSSGLRAYDGALATYGAGSGDERVPDTARSGAATLSVRGAETEEDRLYKESFARGTASFVQGRYAEAADAFDACLKARPADRAAEVMLRRSLAQGEGR
jgi:hypothetical protein